MAKVNDIIQQLKECTTAELDQISDQLKSIRDQVFEEENKERIEKLKMTTTIGKFASYEKGDVKNVGRVVIIKEDSVQLDVEGAARKINVKWVNIQGVSDNKKDAEKSIK